MKILSCLNTSLPNRLHTYLICIFYSILFTQWTLFLFHWICVFEKCILILLIDSLDTIYFNSPIITWNVNCYWRNSLIHKQEIHVYGCTCIYIGVCLYVCLCIRYEIYFKLSVSIAEYLIYCQIRWFFHVYFLCGLVIKGLISHRGEHHLFSVPSSAADSKARWNFHLKGMAFVDYIIKCGIYFRLLKTVFYKINSFQISFLWQL